MFTLPTVPNLIVSTIVFFIVAWYAHRFLDDRDIPKGMARSLSVFALAYLLSWGSGEAVDWMQGTPATEKTSDVQSSVKTPDSSV